MIVLNVNLPHLTRMFINIWPKNKQISARYSLRVIFYGKQMIYTRDINKITNSIKIGY